MDSTNFFFKKNPILYLYKGHKHSAKSSHMP